MPRYRLTIEFDGSGFVGWQRQANGFSVQEALEDAIHAMTGERCTVIGAGRTDSGVHALAMVAHFDLDDSRHSAATVCKALNFHLKPYPVAVIGAVVAAPDFHARLSAIRRRYRYRILNRPAPPVLDRHRVWHVPQSLDTGRMSRAAAALLGNHDFTSFRAAGCQAASPVRTLDSLVVNRQGDEVHVSVAARSFLHRQVRIMTGTLKLVGEGRWTSADVERALGACDRSAAGPTAPAAGLYFEAVDYD